MDKLDFDSVQTYDLRYTNNQIQMLKVMLPFLDPAMRRNMTVLIRFLEFQYTLTMVQKHPEYFQAKACPPEPENLLDQLQKYCPPEVVSMLENFRSIQQAMKMYEDMKDFMGDFQDGSSASETDSGGFPMWNMLSGFLDPEQLAIFQSADPPLSQ